MPPLKVKVPLAAVEVSEKYMSPPYFPASALPPTVKVPLAAVEVPKNPMSGALVSADKPLRVKAPLPALEFVKK